MRARSITAMAHARLPCIFIALLLVPHYAPNVQARYPWNSICPGKEDCVFGLLCPSVQKFDPTLVVQTNFSSRGWVEACTRTFVPAFIIHRNPPNWHPISGFSALILMQIEQTHCTK
jgi:hypothetical protein